MPHRILGALLFLLLCTAPAPAADEEEAGASETSRIRHLLRRATFGARPGDVAEVERLGREAWVDLQLHPERIPDADLEARLEGYETLGLTTTGYWRMLEGAAEPTAPPNTPEGRRQRQARQRLLRLGRVEVPSAVLLRAVYSRRQLQEVMVDFWRNHFNVDVNKAGNEVAYYVADWEREVLRRHVFGSFEELLFATARHPAMLFYLDNHVSQAPRARGERVLRGDEREGRTDGLNENYARELMELHTVGVDNGYDQEDVIQLALVLTGWSIQRRGPERGAFVFEERFHAQGRKRVMGRTIAESGVEEGEAVLRHLARHANTRGFVCGKLVRFLVADDPPETIVDAAVKTWTRTKGDLREVVRTILLHDEFDAASSLLAKAKSPFEFVAGTLRVTGAEVTDPRPILERLADMHQGLYQCEDPTGWPERAEDWMDPGVLAVRWRFAYDVLQGRLPGVSVAESPLWRGAEQSPEVWEYALVDALLGGEAPGPLTMAPFRRRINEIRRSPQGAPRSQAERRQAFAILATLLLGSPEFQRQ